MPADEQTPTQRARELLRGSDYSPREIAAITGLHEAYVRKIRQRDAGQDHAWQRWRDNHPEIVTAWRQKLFARWRAERKAKRNNRNSQCTSAQQVDTPPC